MSLNRRSAGSPPTLWWVLIFWAAFVSDVAEFDDVRIERALGQEVDPAEVRGLLLEHPDELVADDLALLLGVLDTGQPGEEAVSSIDHDEVHPEIAFEGRPEQLRLLLAHQAVVDIDARQPVTDRAVDERRGHCRIDATRQGADDLPVGAGLVRVLVDAIADPGDGGVDEVRRGPGLGYARDAHHEVAQDVPAARRVDDLRVELDAVQPSAGIGQAGERGGVGLGGGLEALGQPRDGIAVAHPHGLVVFDAAEQSVVPRDPDVCRAIFPAVGREDVAAELVGHELRAVADPENRDAPAPDRRVGLRRTVVIDGVRPARQDDAARPALLELGVGRVVREQLRVDVELADAPRDQLGELAAEIEDDDRAGFGAGAVLARCAVGCRRMERGLEIGLDLRIVRSEHAMAGIGCFAVDCFASLLRRGRRVRRLGSLVDRVRHARSRPPRAVAPSLPAAVSPERGDRRGDVVSPGSASLRRRVAK